MSEKMQAAVLHGAKDLRLESRATPELLPGQVLIQVRRAGICGSDLHYFTHGYCAAFVPTRPFILGHELIGEVVELAQDVVAPAVGSRVVADPSRHCGSCVYCRAGRANLCPHTVMLGSASTQPPTDGAFADFVAVRADQCHLAPPELDDGLGAMIEPVAVALHAVQRAGSVSGRTVLVIGGGPIGLLVALTARAFGAVPVVVSDVVPERRKSVLNLGLDGVLDPDDATLQEQVSELGGFEVVFEASGASRALRQAFDLVRPGATIVQIGTLGTQDVPLPANQLMVREVQYIGSFRYGHVFEQAIRLVASGRLKLQSLITAVLPMGRVADAMRLAAAKENVLKVQIQMEADPT
jgi:L-idonate 5-dehydrogenase